MKWYSSQLSSFCLVESSSVGACGTRSGRFVFGVFAIAFGMSGCSYISASGDWPREEPRGAVVASRPHTHYEQITQPGYQPHSAVSPAVSPAVSSTASSAVSSSVPVRGPSVVTPPIPTYVPPAHVSSAPVDVISSDVDPVLETDFDIASTDVGAANTPATDIADSGLPPARTAMATEIPSEISSEIPSADRSNSYDRSDAADINITSTKRSSSNQKSITSDSPMSRIGTKNSRSKAPVEKVHSDVDSAFDAGANDEPIVKAERLEVAAGKSPKNDSADPVVEEIAADDLADNVAAGDVAVAEPVAKAPDVAELPTNDEIAKVEKHSESTSDIVPSSGLPVAASTTRSSGECDKASDEATRASEAVSDADRLFYYRRALRLCPNEAKFHLEIGKIYAGLGRIEDAEQEFRQVLQSHPDNAEAKSQLMQLTGTSGK